MKLIRFFTFALLLFGVSPFVYAQTSQKITLNFKDIPLQEAIKRVESVSKFTFFYDSDKTDLKQRVSLQAKEMPINDAIQSMLQTTNLSFEITNSQIALISKNRDQRKTDNTKKRIKGIVVDKNGEPIIGANISEKESNNTNGTISDIDGQFSLEVSGSSTLIISYIGYSRKEVLVSGKTDFRITLDEETKLLDNIVVVGYGTQKKITLTGAVSAIQNDDIITTKNENVQNMLSGKIAGLRIVQKSSEPGSFSNDVQIRGMGNPLIIIDGVPRDNMNRLDPNEIESISVLKDASAAIYGVRAANGVVLITTKKGKSGKIEFEYTGTVGLQEITGLPKSLNAVEWMTLMNENNLNRGMKPAYSKEEINAYQNGTKKSTDWAGSAINKTAPQTQHHISASGSNDKFDYFVNFGYLKQDGYWKSGDLNYERFNIRSNVSAQLTKNLKLETLISGMMDTKNQPYNDSWLVFKSVWTQIPIWPLYANDNPNYLYSAADAAHPLVITNSDLNGYKIFNQKLFQGTMNLEYTVPFVEGLKTRAMYSYDYKVKENKEFAKEYTLYTYNAEKDIYNPVKGQSPSQLRRFYAHNITSLLQLQMNYNRLFNEVHNVSVLGLYEESTRKADNFYAQRQFSMDAVDQLFAGTSSSQVASMNTGKDDDFYILANKALVGRINYDYSSKYIAEFSFRYDGSSKFAVGHQWGFFPAASLGWRMSEENFMKKKSSLSFVNNLKWRLSYGLMGDDSSSTYQFLTGYNYPSSGYVLGNQWINAFGMRGMANPQITWFTAKMLNAGLDADLWNGLLGLQIDVFQRTRDGLLAKRTESLPGTVGANLPEENLEGDRTKGFEISLSHRNKISDFGYSFSGNFSFTRTMWLNKEIAKQGNSYRNWRNNNTNRWDNIWWGYGYLGHYTSYDQILSSPIQDGKGNSILRPGDYAYEDWNGDGVIDDNDKHPIGINTKGVPRINFGFIMNFDYKNFDLNMTFQGAAMSYIRYPEQLEAPLPWGRNGLALFMDRWHRADPFNPDSEWISGRYASTLRDGETTNYWDSNFWIQNASYLRLKSVELGYNLPQSVLKSTGISRARLFLNGYNVFTLTGLKYVDPEHPEETYGYLYPLSRTYNVGINVTF